jgi:hypothetical protein
MKNFPVYLILGFVAGETWKNGNSGLAVALGFAAAWLMVASYLAAKKQAKDLEFVKEVRTILKEKGY